MHLGAWKRSHDGGGKRDESHDGGREGGKRKRGLEPRHGWVVPYSGPSSPCCGPVILGTSVQ